MTVFDINPQPWEFRSTTLYRLSWASDYWVVARQICCIINGHFRCLHLPTEWHSKAEICFFPLSIVFIFQFCRKTWTKGPQYLIPISLQLLPYSSFSANVAFRSRWWRCCSFGGTIEASKSNKLIRGWCQSSGFEHGLELSQIACWQWIPLCISATSRLRSIGYIYRVGNVRYP